jgi:hypothetical protein
MSEQQQKTPDEIRSDIEKTRGELGDTVEALGAKSDVKGQAKAKVEEVKGTVKEKVAGAAPDSAQQGGQAAVERVRENPAPFAIGAALLAGFLIGRRRAR